MFNDQALFNAKLAQLEEQWLNPDPEPAVEEVAVEPEPAPEPDYCRDHIPHYNGSNPRTGDCQREEITKECLQCAKFPVQHIEPSDESSGCHNFNESYGGYNHGNCHDAERPECPRCTQYPREKWILTQPVNSWSEDEVVEFLETFGLSVKHNTGRWELDNFAEKILNMVKAVAQIAAAKKGAP